MVFGAGGGTSSYREVEDTDLIVLWGSNARETHPIFFHHVLKAVHKGARMYTVDPRRTSSAEWADVWLGLDVGSDIAVGNGGGGGDLAPWPRGRARDHRRWPRGPHVHRARDRRLRGVQGEGRAVHARVRRARIRRPR